MIFLRPEDVSKLAWLAMSPSREDKDEFLASLQPEARKIADVLTGDSKGTVKTRATAQWFREWAEGLGK